MAKKEREYFWYVEALDSHTNEAIASNLGDDKCCGEHLCGDNKRRVLWQLKPEFVAQLRASKEDLHLHFWIFIQEGRGKIRFWPFQKRIRVA